MAWGAALLGVCGIGLAAWLPSDPHFLMPWLPAGFLCGAGVGAISVGVSSAAALSVAPQRFAAATGLNIAARQVGGAVGVAILAVLMSGHLPADGTGPYRGVYLMSAIACVGVLLAAGRLVIGAPAPAPVPSAAAPADSGAAR